MAFTQHPKALEVISSADLADHFKDIASYQDRVLNGFDHSLPGGTDFTVDTGEAYVAGYKVGESGDGDETVTLPNNESLVHIFLEPDGTLSANNSGSDPGNGLGASLKIYTAVTDSPSGSVTSVTDLRDTTVDMDAPVVATSFTADDYLSGLRLLLDDNQPYIEIIDSAGGGDSFRIWNRNGELQLTDPSGASVYVDDLSSLAFGFQQSALDYATAPAGGESGGERYIVQPTGTGAFSGQDNDIAEYNGATWDFTTPSEGWIVFVEDEDELYYFSGSAWAKFGTNAATASKLVRRDSNSRASFAEPAAAGQALVAGGLPFLHTETTGTTLTPAVNSANTVNNAAGVTVTLPTTFDQGDWIIIVGGDEAAGFTVAPGTGDTIENNGDTITDVDTLDFAEAHKSVILIANEANANWVAFSGGAGGFKWNEETGTSITLLPANAYFSTNAALATAETFAGPTFGKEFYMKGELDKGGWKITAADGVRIVIGPGGAGIGETPTTATYAIIGVNATNESFLVDTDVTAQFYAGQSIVVSGSTGNDGTYTVVSAVLESGDTRITVEEDVTSAVADGDIDVVGSISSDSDDSHVTSAQFTYMGGNDWYCEPRLGTVVVD